MLNDFSDLFELDSISWLKIRKSETDVSFSFKSNISFKYIESKEILVSDVKEKS